MNKLYNLLLYGLNFLKVPKSINRNIIGIFLTIFPVLNLHIIFEINKTFDFIFHFNFKNNVLIVELILSIFFIINLFQIFFKKTLLGIMSLLISGFLFRGFFTFGIFELTHLILSWINIFSLTFYNSPDGGKYNRLGLVGLFFSFILLGLIFFSAGIDKIIDPYWQKGIGFLNFVEMEWVTTKFYREIFKQPLLYYLGNYLGILIELFFLPLFIFTKTRKAAVFLYTILAIQLFFPFKIFYIGVIAVLLILPMQSLANGKDNLVFENLNSLKTISVSMLIVGTLFIVTLLRFVQIELSMVRKNTIFVEKTFSKKFDFSQLSENSNYLKEFSDYFKLNEIKNPINFVFNRYLTRGPVGLFSVGHTVGIFEYKIIVKTEEGNEIEPVVFFKSDGERGEIIDTSFTLNHFQAANYIFTDLVYNYHSMNDNDFENHFKNSYNNIILPLINFVIEKSNINKKSINCVKVLVRKIGKDCKENLKEENLIDINYNKNQLNIYKVDIQNCVQGRNKNLKYL